MLSIEIQRRYKRLCVTHLACQRLQEAVTEIKKTAHVDPVLAADGLVTLPEGIWPAFQHIHASSGALGGAVGWTQSELLPLLIDAPADRSMQGKWLKRRRQAIEDGGVDYLWMVQERWGELCASRETASQ